MQMSTTTNATNNGPHKVIEFVDFVVFNAWKFSKYNVRRDPIFEVETLMGTHRVKGPLTTELVSLKGF